MFQVACVNTSLALTDNAILAGLQKMFAGKMPANEIVVTQFASPEQLLAKMTHPENFDMVVLDTASQGYLETGNVEQTSIIAACIKNGVSTLVLADAGAGYTKAKAESLEACIQADVTNEDHILVLRRAQLEASPVTENFAEFAKIAHATRIQKGQTIKAILGDGASTERSTVDGNGIASPVSAVTALLGRVGCKAFTL